jgi:hypothetical protein
MVRPGGQGPRFEYKGQQGTQPSTSRPGGPPGQVPRPKANPIATLIGQRITIHNKAGMVYTGKLTLNEGGFLRLEDCTIVGSRHRATAAWVLVDRTVIAHIHPADVTVEGVEVPQE